MNKNDFINVMGYIDGITIIDTSGTILFSVKFNSLFYPDFYDSKNIVGKKLTDVFTNLDEEKSTLFKAMKLDIPVFRKKQPIINMCKDKIYTTNISIPIKANNKIVGAIELSKDKANYKCTLPNDTVEINLDAFNSNNFLTKFFGPDKARYTLDDIVSNDQNMKKLKEYVKKIGNSNSPVFIYGETGTGKELFAHAIQNASSRSEGPFIVQNCAAIPENLMESILFGTTKGSFTGAFDKPGLFEIAEGGSLFLDEINSMSLNLQAKLLRVLQDGFIRRLGDRKERKTNVRIITTANINPMECVKRGQLRQDIYYRICVFTINIPPLRDRHEDIQFLLAYFIDKYNPSLNRKVKRVSKEVYQFLNGYKWPGNVRQFEHFIEYAMNNVDESEDTIKMEHIESKIKEMTILDNDISGDILPLKDAVSAVEKNLISKAVNITKGNVSQAAKLLKIPRQTLQQKIQRYNIINN